MLKFVKVLKFEIDSYYIEDKYREANYEDLYYISKQIHDSETWEYDNPAVQALIDKLKTNKDLEEILEFVLAQCRSCGKYYTTKRAIKDVLTAYSESVSGFDEEFKEMIYLCPDCRRRELTERFAEASKGETV